MGVCGIKVIGTCNYSSLATFSEGERQGLARLSQFACLMGLHPQAGQKQGPQAVCDKRDGSISVRCWRWPLFENFCIVERAYKGAP